MRFWITALLSLACTRQPQPQGQSLAPSDSGPDDAGACIVNGVYHMPNPAWTPGTLCTEQSPDFDGFRYKAHIAHCARDIRESEKDFVARLYGIPKSDYHLYEFDHLVPLNAGGSNDPKNLWPQPLDDAKLKDKVEEEVYLGLKNGTMTEDEVVAKLHAWKSPACP